MEAASWTVSSSLRLTGKTSRSSPRISRTPWSRPRTSAGDRREKRLVIALNRFDWEAANDVTPQFRRRRAALRFERVSACKCRNCTPVEKDQVLNLLAVSFEATDQPAGVITLMFSGGAALRLEVECLEAELADLGPTWGTECCPAHTDIVLDGEAVEASKQG